MADSHYKKDIVDTAVSAASFNTLVAAVEAADLEETLKGKGPFTVFAPTDDAFGKLSVGTVESLAKRENRDNRTLFKFLNRFLTLLQRKVFRSNVNIFSNILISF